ncbi:MAG: pyridoxal-phosphate dependent enzyme [Candidatus Zixiibacteriota bacterium]
MIENNLISSADLISAADRIKPYIHRTPVLTSSLLDDMTNAKLYFKCENFQKIGAFKFRGACNAIYSKSSDDLKNGVATHSSGNFAQAIALAARCRHTKAYIVMPENAPKVKSDAVRSYGAEIIYCKPTQQAREETLKKVVDETGAVFFHPYDDTSIIAGQATSAIELLDEIKNLDMVMTPIGGGGLTSGTALAVKYFTKNTKMIAAEPEMADDAYRSFKSKTLIPSENPATIADGLKTSLGKITFPIVMNYVDEIFTVSERHIIRAMRILWERMKIVVEPSGAVPLGVVLQHRGYFENKKIGIIISGGNVDLDKLPWMI